MQIRNWFNKPLSFGVKLAAVILALPLILGVLSGAAYLGARLVSIVQSAIMRFADRLSWSPPTSLEGLIQTCLGLVALILILMFLFGSGSRNSHK